MEASTKDSLAKDSLAGLSKIAVAIDGPAGAGKSTVARMIAERLGLVFMNTGSFYRGLALLLLREGGGATDGSSGKIDLSNKEKIIEAAARHSFDYTDEGLFVDGELVETYLRSDAVERVVSPVSAIPEVRRILNKKIRAIGEGRGVVCEGRDMTTVVFPGTPFKFYLDASAETRARRRFEQGTSKLTLEEIKAAIEERDALDRDKPEGSLQIAPDAFYIDSSILTIENVCAIILAEILKRGQEGIHNGSDGSGKGC